MKFLHGGPTLGKTSAMGEVLLVCTSDLVGAQNPHVACHPPIQDAFPLPGEGVSADGCRPIGRPRPRARSTASSCSAVRGPPLKSRMQPYFPLPGSSCGALWSACARFGGGCRIDWRSRLQEPAATSGRCRPVDSSVLSYPRRTHHSKQTVVYVCARPTVWHFAAHPASAAVGGSVTSRRIAAACCHSRL